MCKGLCGLFSLLFLLSGLPGASGEVTLSPKEQAIALSLSQEVLLIQSRQDLTLLSKEIELTKNQLAETQTNDTQRYNELSKRLDEKEASYNLLMIKLAELSKSVETSEQHYKQAENELTIDRWIIIGETVLIAGYITGKFFKVW